MSDNIDNCEPAPFRTHSSRFRQRISKQQNFVLPTKTQFLVHNFQNAHFYRKFFLHNSLALAFVTCYICCGCSKCQINDACVLEREKSSIQISTSFAVVQRYSIDFSRFNVGERCITLDLQQHSSLNRISKTTKKCHILGQVFMSRRKYDGREIVVERT